MSPKSENSIMDAFKEEVREHGIANVTIGNVAKRCNCARQTVYYHFEGVSSLIKKIVSDDRQQTGFSDESPWARNTYSLLNNLKNNEDLILDIQNSKYKEDLHEDILNYCHEKIVNELLVPCSNYGTYKSRGRIGKLINYCIAGYILDWINNGLYETPEEVMSELNRLCGSSMQHMITDYLTLRPSESPGNLC